VCCCIGDAECEYIFASNEILATFSRVFVSHTFRYLSNELDVNIPVSAGHHRTPVIANSWPLCLS
jgi:hypothetical protein